MMGRKSNQVQMVIVDIQEMIPEHHLLRQIEKAVSFEFIYEIAEPYYARKGRPSVDPVCLIKMLLIGYLYGICSERQLIEEISLNIAYRWFCGFDLGDRIPEHSIFSQNRHRRFQDEQIFRDIFNTIVIQCIERGLVSGECVVSDGSFIPGNVALQSKTEVNTVVEKSTVHYLDCLEDELREMEGFMEA